MEMRHCCYNHAENTLLSRGGLEGANYINERPMHQRKFAVSTVWMFLSMLQAMAKSYTFPYLHISEASIKLLRFDFELAIKILSVSLANKDDVVRRFPRGLMVLSHVTMSLRDAKLDDDDTCHT
jgi:hypothetical protein